MWKCFRCFNVLQKHFPVDIYDRMLYSIGRQNWQPMGSYYWITHLVHLLLLSDCPAGVIPALSSSSGGSTDDGNASEFTTEKTKCKNWFIRSHNWVTPKLHDFAWLSYTMYVFFFDWKTSAYYSSAKYDRQCGKFFYKVFKLSAKLC